MGTQCDSEFNIIFKFCDINEDCSSEQIVPISKLLSYGNRVEQNTIGNSAPGS